MIRHISLLFLLVLNCNGLLFAQLFPNRVFTEDKGLSQKFIFSITQDTNGVLLLGTENGIASFNGDHFSSVASMNGLPGKEISCVLADSRGRTWMGHFQNGVSCVINGVTERVDTSVQVNGRITSLAEDRNGNTWGISEGRGIFCISGVTRKINFPAGGEIQNGQIVCDNSRLVAGTDDGVHVYMVDADNSIHEEYVLPDTRGKTITACTQGYIFGKKFLFVAAAGTGIYCYEISGENYNLVSFLGPDLQCHQMEFSSLTCDRSNALWIGTIGEGLRKISFNPTGFPQRIDRFTQADGLSDDNIKSLFADAEDNIWLGTFGHGLVEIPYSVFHFYNQSNGLIRPEVNCVTQDLSGALWLGTDSGITRFTGNQSGCKDGAACSKQYGKAEGFADVEVTCMVTDTTGLIWIGTSENGLYRLNPVTEKFENISAERKLDVKTINTLTVTNEGNILAGTTQGVYVYDCRQDKFSFLTTMEGLLHNDVHHLYTDRANSVWFSSAGTPPYALHDEQFFVFNEIDNLKGYMIEGVCEDYAGTRWIATGGDGVFAYNGIDFHQYTSANGLKSDNCIATIAEDNGILWVVHQSGLSMKFPDDTAFRYFSAMDNRLLQELNAPVFRASNGTLYFCSENGLIEIPSQDKEYLRRVPKISLSRMFINGVEREIATDIELSAGTYNLSFEFNSILLSSAGFNPFYYRIIGADSAWRQSTDRNVIIPQLTYGDYILEVAGETGGRQNVAHPFIVRIHIDYPIWQRTWFIITMILLGPVLLLIGIRLRTLQLMRINKRLFVLVKEKTHLLEAEKESVARMHTELKSKTKDITDSIHYAMRIQMAILPDVHILHDALPQSFIFYRPRDIVSGDFYWFAEKGDLVFIAVVDCTGHGVPGAFMSMIGSTLMNKVVFDYRIDRPSGVLDLLNREIKLALHQHDSIDSSHDGMDLALCVLDKRKGTLWFSGAGRPLIMVRNNELSLYKTNKGGLGGVYSHKTQLFDEIEIKVQPGDMFYMYSDGFTDQFGANGNSKFSSPRLRAILPDLAGLPVEEQKHKLAQIFDEWMGDTDQCDDVLVIGFRTD